MKLYISETLKRLRQSRDLTQEQLADMLGVSFQSVSRWETGVSYPDIELIPEIAAFFEVTTDALMGVEKATMEKNLEEDKKNLWKINKEGELSNEEHLALARELHRKYPHDAELLYELIFWLSPVEHPDEIRRLVKEYFNHPDARKFALERCIMHLVAAEDEENLPAALDKYAVDIDLSRSALLDYRTQDRGESQDKLRAYRQYNLYSRLVSLFHAMLPTTITPPWFNWNPKAERAVWLRLSIINLLTGTDGMDFIAGDGEPDLWFEERRAYGYYLAGYHVLAGKTEEAFAVLESVVSLCEKFYSLPEGTTLTFRCPELSELSVTFRYGKRNPDDVQDFSQNLYRCMREEGTFYGVNLMYDRKNGEEEFDHYVMCPVWDITPLTDTEEWSCFDSIREDERFQNFIRRMEKFIIPVDAD